MVYIYAKKGLFRATLGGITVAESHSAGQLLFSHIKKYSAE